LKKLFSIFILLMVLIASSGYLVKSKQNISLVSNWKVYSNAEYKVTLKYPSNWKPNPKYNDRFDGPDGFFQITALSGEGVSIDYTANNEANHILKPYGTSPVISKLIIDGQEARLIMPSKDQAKENNNQASLIIKYLKPVKINNDTYYYFILWSNKSYIKEIGNTIKFIK
jgi:hypothetical protein